MSEAEILQYIGYLFASYAGGFGSGFIFLTFKKAADKL